MLKNMLNKIYTILRSKLFYFLVLITFSLPLVYESLPVRIDITQQDSLANKIWITYKDISLDTKYVLFIPPFTKYTKNSDIKYLKKIGCREGQNLSIKENKYFCDNELIGIAKEKDMNGVKLEKFEFNGIVPKDKYFVIGTHEYSFDSKYFGFIDKSQILRKAKPFNE